MPPRRTSSHCSRDRPWVLTRRRAGRGREELETEEAATEEAGEVPAEEMACAMRNPFEWGERRPDPNKPLTQQNSHPTKQKPRAIHQGWAGLMQRGLDLERGNEGRRRRCCDGNGCIWRLSVRPVLHLGASLSDKSSDQLQCLIQCPLLEVGPLAEPGAVESVLLRPGPAFVIHELGHGVQQTPSRSLG